MQQSPECIELSKDAFTAYEFNVLSVNEDLCASSVHLKAKSLPFGSFLPVYNQQVGPHIRALGEGLMPGGQQIDITDQPVTTAREAQPARRADGWM